MTFDNVRQDVRAAARSLRRTPLITTVAVITLAVGIASVSTVFSFMNSVFLRPLPYPDAGRIVALTAVSDHRYWFWSWQPLQAVEALRRGAKSFERIAALRETYGSIVADGDAFSATRTEIDTSVIALIGARAQRGRLPTAAEIASSAPVAVISDSLWRSHFGAREDIATRTISINGVATSVIGVLQPGIRFYERSDLLVPLVERPDTVAADDVEGYVVLGKLRPNVSVAAAQAEYKRLGDGLKAADAQFKGWTWLVEDGMYQRDRGFGPIYFWWVFVAIASCVLLIACTNIANLLQVRAAERRREMALRVSLGASRARLLQQGLTESLVLGGIAAALGVFLTTAGIRLVLASIPLNGIPGWITWGVDVRVLAFAVAVTLVAVAAYGLAPARQSSTVDPIEGLKAGGGQVVTDRSAMRSGRQGIVLETALSTMLFVGAVLLWRSYANASRIQPGDDGARVTRVGFPTDRVRYPDNASWLRFARGLTDRLTADPGVEATAIITNGAVLEIDAAQMDSAEKHRRPGTPHISYSNAAGVFLPGQSGTNAADDRWSPAMRKNGVSDSYFRVMGIPIVQGRGFEPADRGGPPVAIISQAAAAALWHRPNVVGERLKVGRNGHEITIIGVARNVTEARQTFEGMTAAPMPDLYLPESQVRAYNPFTLIRPRGDTRAATPLIVAAIRSVDPTIATPSIDNIGETRARAALLPRLIGSIIGAFAIAGLLLAAIGIYGVIGHSVASRTREIGVRIALGGTPARVVQHFIRGGLGLVVRGVALGVLLGAAASQGVRPFLLGVSTLDLGTYAGVIVFFMTVGVVACWVPSRRAARVQPAEALRGD